MNRNDLLIELVEENTKLREMLGERSPCHDGQTAALTGCAFCSPLNKEAPPRLLAHQEKR